MVALQNQFFRQMTPNTGSGGGEAEALTAVLADVKEMTGSIATTTDAAAIKDNVLMLDPLYAVIFRYARQTEFTEEARDFNGTSCTAAVYPATEYTPETVFFFDEADRLVGVVEEKPVVNSALEIGKTVYTVHVIDDQIDEALFDISGYTIS